MKREREGGKGKERETNRFQSYFRNSFTLFVDDLPSTIDTWWLRMMFNDYGVIVDAYIPRKTRAKSNSKFGFVRYRYRSEADLAIEKMNGTRRHNAILKVSMAQYGRERADSRNGDGSYNKGNIQGMLGVQRKTYRQALTGEKLSSNIGIDFYHSQSTMKAVEAIKARVAFLELEVARLQHALTFAMSDGKLKKASDASFSVVEGQQMEEEIGGEDGNTSTIIEGQQMEKVTGGDGQLASYDGDGISGVRNAIVNRRDREKSPLGEVAGSDSITDSISDVTAESFSGERWSAGSGEGIGKGSKSGVINDINDIVSRDDWDSKKEVQTSAITETGEALNGVRCVIGLGLNDGILSGKKISNLGQNVIEEDPNSFEMGHIHECSFVKSSVDTNLESIDMITHAWANSRDVCVSSDDEETLDEFELYRQYFDTSKDRKHKDCSFRGRLDNMSSSVEMEGDRKSCISVNIRKRTKGQNKKKKKSKRRNYAIFRWMGVKRRFAFVFSRRILAES